MRDGSSLRLVQLNGPIFLGWIVGAIWLAFLGEWGALGIALLTSALVVLFGARVCGIALMPGTLVTFLALRTYAKGARAASYPLMLVGQLWTVAVMSGWALLWFGFLQARATASSLVPMLLIAFMLATQPWVYIHMKEQTEVQSEDQYAWVGVSIGTFFLQIACAVIVVIVAFAGASTSTALVAFLLIMGIAPLIGAGMGIGMVSSRAGAVRNIE